VTLIYVASSCGCVFLQLRPDDGGPPRYEVPRTVVDVQQPAFNPTNPRRYTVNVVNADRFAFQVIRRDTGSVLYAGVLLPCFMEQFELHIFRPRRMHGVRKMRPITTDVARSVVCVYVCLCIGHTDVLCKTDEPIEMPFGGLSG